MTTKDYVYLALIAISAMVFYLNGYLAGRSAKRKNRAIGTEAVRLPDPVVFTITLEELAETHPHPVNRLQERETVETVKCVFGHN